MTNLAVDEDQDDADALASSPRKRAAADADFLSDSLPNPSQAERIVISPSAVPSVLPLDIRLMIVEYLSSSRINALGKLQLVSKEWYFTIVNGDAVWKKRAKALGAQRRANNSSWFQTFLKFYRTKCVECGRTNAAGSSIAHHAYGEPDQAKICRECIASGIYETIRPSPASGLSDEEMASLERKGVGVYSKFWFNHEFRAVLAAKHRREKELKEAQTLKRLEEAEEIAATCTAEEKVLINSLLAAQFLRSAFATPFDRDLYNKLFENSENPITKERLLHLTSLRNHHQFSVDLVKAELARLNLTSALEIKLPECLQWKVCLPGQDSTNRMAMSSWSQAIALNQKTAADFVREIQNPTISHAYYNCSCGNTPALACTYRKCSRCCPKSGCPRHPSYNPSFRRNSYGRYGLYGSRGYDSFGYGSSDDGYSDYGF